MSELNDNENKEVEQEVNKAFGLDEDALDENPKLAINKKEIDMENYIEMMAKRKRVLKRILK